MMTTPAHGNFPESSAKLEGGFEASGLSPEEAERFAAAFKPSWEFDEAPFAEGGAALRNGDLEALEAGGAREVHRPDSARAYTAPAHAPPARVETHEPEVSVIIDRSITAAADVRAPVAAMPASVAAPLAAAAVSPNRVVAPVARSRFNADESLELPTSLKKSNKGLFIGLGAAVTAAVLVFAVRAAMSSPDEPAAAAASTTAISAAAPAKTATGPSIPPPPTPAPPVAAPPVTQVSSLPPSHPLAAPTPAPAPAPKPASHAAAPPVHHTPPPRSTPKPASGGIVRDVPF
jgi:hypothetical protein